MPAPCRPVGVPAYFALRGLYQTRSLEAAVEAVEEKLIAWLEARRAEKAVMRAAE